MNLDQLGVSMDNLLAAVQRNPDGTVTLRFLACTEDGEVLVGDQTIHAGDRRPTSTVESYKSVKEDWNYAIVDLSVDSTIIYAGPAIIGNVWVNTVMSAHACPIKDDTTTVVELPASSAAGYALTHAKGTRFETSLVVDPDDAATGIIVVQWRKL